MSEENVQSKKDVKIITERWANGNKRRRYILENNIKEGVEFEWDSEENLIAEIPYVNGRKHGDIIEYYTHSGKVRKTTPFYEGKEDGGSAHYDEKGKILAYDVFEDGKLMKPDEEIDPNFLEDEEAI